MRAVKEHSGALNRTRVAVGLSVAARYSREVFDGVSVRSVCSNAGGTAEACLSSRRCFWHFQGRYFFVSRNASLSEESIGDSLEMNDAKSGRHPHPSRLCRATFPSLGKARIV